MVDVFETGASERKHDLAVVHLVGKNGSRQIMRGRSQNAEEGNLGRSLLLNIDFSASSILDHGHNTLSMEKLE